MMTRKWLIPRPGIILKNWSRSCYFYFAGVSDFLFQSVVLVQTSHVSKTTYCLIVGMISFATTAWLLLHITTKGII